MPGKWGFTLLELMTVVTIMLILMGLSFMAFQQLNSAGNVSAAASELSNFVMQARQHAITYGTPVRVGIAMDTNNGAAPLQTYAAYARNIIVLNETTGAATTNWSSISGARFLPRGVFFDYDFPAKSADYDSTNFLKYAVGDGSYLANKMTNIVTRIVSAGTSNVLYFFEFDVDGSLSNPDPDSITSSKLGIPLSAARSITAASPYTTPVLSADYSNRTNYSMCVDVSALTGKTRILRKQ